MTRIQERLKFLAFCCLLLQTSSTTVTHKDVSHEWLNDFLLQLSSPKCQQYSIDIDQKTFEENARLPWNKFIVMEGNTVNLTLTQCDGRESPPVHLHLHQPELVKDLQCYRTSLRDAACSWNARVKDLKFFYVFVNESEIENVSSTLAELSFQVRECPQYVKADGAGRRCSLDYLGTHIFVSVRGGKDGPSFNTFRMAVTAHVRLPALSWNVTEAAEKFDIHWDYPEIEIPATWKIRIKYVECGQSKFKEEMGGDVRRAVVNRVSHCPYRLAIQATSTKGNTTWTQERSFGARTDPLAYAYVAIFTPLVMAGLVAAAFICFRRNKDVIFPKIPEPRNLLAGIPDISLKGTLNRNYPALTEETCRISLVSEPTYANMKTMKHPLL